MEKNPDSQTEFFSMKICGPKPQENNYFSLIKRFKTTQRTQSFAKYAQQGYYVIG